MYYFLLYFLPVAYNGVETSQDQVMYYDVASGEYDPFSNYGFNFAFGMNSPLDPTIGVFQLEYLAQTWNNDT